LTRNVSVTDAAATAIRLSALVLAADVHSHDGAMRHTLRHIAAGITLVQKRMTDTDD
jgi:hypothetical protein